MYLSERVLEPYWINTSGNAIIKEIAINSAKEIQFQIEDLMVGKVLCNKPINQFMVYGDIKASGDNIWTFLLMSGYLKAVKTEAEGRETTYCDLMIPNKEILSFFRQKYQTWIRETMPQGSEDALIKALVTKNTKENAIYHILNPLLYNFITIMSLKENVEKMLEDADRPLVYLNSSKTSKDNKGKIKFKKSYQKVLLIRYIIINPVLFYGLTCCKASYVGSDNTRPFYKVLYH